MKTAFHACLCLSLGLVATVVPASPASGQETSGSTVQIGPITVRDAHKGSSDATAVGNDIVIREGQTNHNVVAVLGDVEINGTVTGDLVVVLGNVTVGPSGEVQRPMVLVGGQLTAHPEARIQEFQGPSIALPGWLTIGTRDWVKQGLFWGRPLPHRPDLSWWVAGACLLFYLLLELLFPRPIQACVQRLTDRPASSFLTGLLSILLLGPIVLLLVASLVGAVVVPFLVCGCVLAFLFGKVGVYQYAGQHLGRQMGLAPLNNAFVALTVGTLLFFLIYMVPILGFVVWGIVATFGFGAVILATGQSLRAELPAADAGRDIAPPVPVKAGGSDTASPEISQEPILLPRAGFWIRLAATVLDVILIGAIVSAFRMRSLFLPIWVFYHLAMWTWKGTSVGGLVFGLRIVRVQGEPIGFGVALVRCLSAFFSALVLFVGFFWVGWNRERQSWHDIIAGTVIVRYPKGTPLI